jgi:hypothetical protein
LAQRGLGVAAPNQAGPNKKYFSAGRRCSRMWSVRVGMIATTSGLTGQAFREALSGYFGASSS